jgi:hypothetical protein
MRELFEQGFAVKAAGSSLRFVIAEPGRLVRADASKLRGDADRAMANAEFFAAFLQAGWTSPLCRRGSRNPSHQCQPRADGARPGRAAARFLKIAPKTLRLAAEAGEITAIHPLSDGPWIFARADLSASTAKAITERARQNPKHPAGSHPDQQNLFSSIT